MCVREDADLTFHRQTSAETMVHCVGCRVPVCRPHRLSKQQLKGKDKEKRK